MDLEPGELQVSSYHVTAIPVWLVLPA
jgi:hypothetical protein